jgi:hypothetical protein
LYQDYINGQRGCLDGISVCTYSTLSVVSQ